MSGWKNLATGVSVLYREILWIQGVTWFLTTGTGGSRSPRDLRCEMKRPWLPALVLFFAAPAVGELLCGNMPPFKFFNPFSLLCVAALYGGGAILIRELALRWGKGWPTILALGAAYAAVEEGLMVKSYFNPEGPAAFLKDYGWWGGVNWPWVTDMTLYHGVHSIAVSILLVEVLFPARRGESWAKGRTLIILGLLLAADVLLGFLLFGAEDRPGGPPFRPPAVPYVATAGAVVLLVLLARYLPAGIRPRGPDTPAAARPVWFWLIGFAGAFAFMLKMFASPHLVPPVVQVLIGAGLACLVGWRLWRMSRGGAVWTDRHRLAVIAGDFCLFILFLPIVEFNQGAAKRGTTAVALAALAFLLVLWWHVRRRGQRTS
jgi:hypothetical protein